MTNVFFLTTDKLPKASTSWAICPQATQSEMNLPSVRQGLGGSRSGGFSVMGDLLSFYIYQCVKCKGGEHRTRYPRKTPYLCTPCQLRRFRQEIYPLRVAFPPIRKRLLKQRGSTCENCGEETADPHVHHILPLSLGGDNSRKNLQVLCKLCHDGKHTNGRASSTDINTVDTGLIRIEYRQRRGPGRTP